MLLNRIFRIILLDGASEFLKILQSSNNLWKISQDLNWLQIIFSTQFYLHIIKNSNLNSVFFILGIKISN